MTQPTDNQWERIEAALLAVTHSIQTLAEETRATNQNINNLVEHLFTRRDVVANDVVDIKNDLYELKEVSKEQSSTAKEQAATVRIQAENIRVLIEMINRRQA